jgi:phage terminase large subunit GpA-like protein
LRRCGHPRTYALYGASGPDKQSLLVIPHKSKQYKMNLYSVGTDSAKDILFARIKLKEPGPRYMHWPTGNGYEKRKEGYFDQLTAEELKTEIKKGRIEKHYELKPGVKRNEALDIRVYFLAAVDILRPAVSVIKRELLRKLDANRPAITSAMPPRRPVETLISSESENIPEPKPSQPRKRFSMRAKM